MPWSCESLANNPIVAKKVTDESTVFAFSLGGSNFEFGLKWSRCSPLFGLPSWFVLVTTRETPAIYKGQPTKWYKIRLNMATGPFPSVFSAAERSGEGVLQAPLWLFAVLVLDMLVAVAAAVEAGSRESNPSSESVSGT